MPWPVVTPSKHLDDKRQIFCVVFWVTRVKGADKRGGTPDTVGGCFL